MLEDHPLMGAVLIDEVQPIVTLEEEKPPLHLVDQTKRRQARRHDRPVVVPGRPCLGKVHQRRSQRGRPDRRFHPQRQRMPPERTADQFADRCTDLALGAQMNRIKRALRTIEHERMKDELEALVGAFERDLIDAGDFARGL